MIKLLRFFDKHAGNLIILFLLIFKKSSTAHLNNPKVLIVKLWAIGDSILTLPLIRGLKESHENCEVDVLLRTRVKDVYECYNINRIYNLDSLSDIRRLIQKCRSYDIVFDCEPYFNISAILAFLLGKFRIGFANQFRSKLYSKTVEFKKNQHMVQNYLDMSRSIDINYNTSILEKLSVSETNKKRVNDFISNYSLNKPKIGITPGISESSKNRMWFEDRFAKVADTLMDHYNADVIFIDSHRNKKIVDRIVSLMKHKPINTLGMFTLKETFYLISKCDVFLCNDTGPMHIAAAQGVKTIGLFGPNTPILWGPYGENNTSIYKTTLEPAIQNDKGIFKSGNREEYMGPITVEMVLEAIKSKL